MTIHIYMIVWTLRGQFIVTPATSLGDMRRKCSKIRGIGGKIVKRRKLVASGGKRDAVCALTEHLWKQRDHWSDGLGSLTVGGGLTPAEYMGKAKCSVLEVVIGKDSE